jgi:hypothetical protein
VADDEKRKENLKARRAAGYPPARRPKLRVTVLEPPAMVAPIAPEPGDDPGRFGEAPEDGLRMLAALETMTSLEPDYCDDLAAEASVTIIETAAGAGEGDRGSAEEAPRGSLRARLGGVREAPDIDADEYAAYHGPVEEAIVEIIELPGPEADASAPREDKKLPVAHRFFKALTGGR